MEKETGHFPKIPTDSSLRGIPNPYEDLILTYESQLDSIKGKKPIFEQFPLTFVENYINKPEVSEIIKKLKKSGGKLLAYENIWQYLSSGLINLAKPQKIPELSDYQRKNIADSFTRYFYLFVESVSQISINNKPPSRSIIQLLIENPNYLEPNFYELFFNQIKQDGYYSKTNIFMALKESPKNAKEILENNNETFETIITILKTHNSTRIINFSAIRHLVDTKKDEAKDIIDKNIDNYYLIPNQKRKYRKSKKERIETKEKTDLIETFKQIFKGELDPLIERINLLEHQNEELCKALSLNTISSVSADIKTRPPLIPQSIKMPKPAPDLSPKIKTPIQLAPKTISDRTNLDTHQPKEQIQKENDLRISRSRNHPNIPLVTQIDSSLKQKYQDLPHPLLTDIVINKFLNKYSQPEVEIEKAISIYESLVEKFKEKIKKNNTILLAITEACLSNEDDSVSFVSRYIDRFDSFIKNEKYSNIIRSIIASTTINLITKEITLVEAISKLNYESTQW